MKAGPGRLDECRRRHVLSVGLRLVAARAADEQMLSRGVVGRRPLRRAPSLLLVDADDDSMAHAGVAARAARASSK